MMSHSRALHVISGPVKAAPKTGSCEPFSSCPGGGVRKPGAWGAGRARHRAKIGHEGTGVGRYRVAGHRTTAARVGWVAGTFMSVAGITA